MAEPLTMSIDRRGVATLTLNRPEKRNALDAAAIAALAQAARRVAADGAVRVVVLTGAGAAFCAGADLAWMREQIGADAATRVAGARELAEMLNLFNLLPKPVIGHVNGDAFGGGVGLMAVCDLAIGLDTARFGLTETRLGLIPATIGPYVVARIGAAAARRVMLSGRLFSAAEARDMGFLGQVAESADLEAAVAAEVTAHLAAAPGAIAEAKAMLRRMSLKINAEVVDDSIAALIRRWQDPESAEGIAAFFDKRRPDWRR